MNKTVKEIFLLSAMLIGILVIDGELRNGLFSFGEGKKGYLFLPENFAIGKSGKFILYLPGRGSVIENGTPFASEHYAEFRRICSAEGYVVAVASLESSWFNAQAEKDVNDMLDYLAEKLQMDLSRIHLMGGSMGSMSAMIFAGRNYERVISICNVFGPFDLKAFYEGSYRENIRAAYGGYYEQMSHFYESRNPKNYVSLLKNIPMLIIHGDADWQVKPEQSQELCNTLKAIGGNQVELIIVPGVGHHNGIVRGLESKIISFMESCY